MKRGFVILELLIATLIGGMLTAALALALFQSGRVQERVDSLVSVSARAMMLQMQLERDLAGIFLPCPQDEQPVPEKKEAAGVDKKKEVKEISRIFYGLKSEKNLKELTFLTHNAMQAYWGSKLAKPRPRMARVVYKLEQDAEQKNSFNVMRQEGIELDAKAYEQKAKEPIRAYQLIEGVKEFSVRYRIKVPEKTDQKEDAKNKPPEYKVVDEWDTEKEDQKKEEQKERPPVPTEVELHLVLWDSKYEKETVFDFVIPIIVDCMHEKKAMQSQGAGKQAPAESKQSVQKLPQKVPAVPTQKTAHIKNEQQSSTTSWLIFK